MLKTLITADDFGFSKDINRAIIDAYQEGSVKELSLMVDSFGTDDAVEYIKKHNITNVGIHFSLVRISQNGKQLRSNDYDEIFAFWTPEQLAQAFDEEVALFESKVGFAPKHIIGHKHITLHPKLVTHVNAYILQHDCYTRRRIQHETLKALGIGIPADIRMTDHVLAFHYGSPEEMYRAYKTDIQKAKAEGTRSIEILFHPGYPGDFEKQYTSFIQERIDDVNFLLSDYFKRLVEEEELQLVSSSEI